MPNSKQALAVLVVLALLMGGYVYVFGLPRPPRFVIHGYDGPEATIVDVKDSYPAQYNLKRVTIGDTYAEVDLRTADWFDAITACGLKAEIMGAPNILSYETLKTIERSEIVGDKNVTKTWEVQKVKCTMEITMSTFQGGLASLFRTEFWIQLRENAFSVFSTANESTAFIINVYTIEAADIVGSFTPTPSEGGYDFPLTSVESFKTPQWIVESGYTTNLNGFRVVKFPVIAADGSPTFFFGRSESSATIHIGMDLLLFGMWEETKDYRQWEVPDPWEWLFLLLKNIGAVLATGIGILGTVVILWKAPGMWKAVGLVIVWLPALYLLGVFDPLIVLFSPGG